VRPTVRTVRRLLGSAAAVLALVVLGGCSAPSGMDSGGADGGAVAVPQPASPGDEEGAPAGDADADRQVVTTASASLAVDDPAESAQRISELVESVGGRVDERTEWAGSGGDDAEGASADLVVRVPSDELTGVLADLEELGDVASVSVSRSDVTSTVVDLDARISALRTSVARLQVLMEGAATTEALLEAEQALSERQQELESLLSRRAQLADQVELSTLSVHLATHGVAPAGGPDGFLDGFATGWRALTTAVGAGIIAVGVLLPWLAAVGLVTAAVLVPLRLKRRRAVVEAPPPA
jgi:hypothetical protein